MPEKLQNAFRDLVSGLLPWPLFIHGPPGTGKTCAALALCDHVRYALHVTAYQLVDEVFDAIRTKGAFNWEKYRPIEVEGPTAIHRRARLVVLDEIGVRANVTDIHYETVQRLIDMREGYPLILISNLDARGLSKVYDDRIASRVEAGTVVELKGIDRRTTG